jgi:cytochrome d ubiquinol oxidase subunit II
MKTEGALLNSVKMWVRRCTVFFLCCYALLTIFTFYYAHYMTWRITSHWFLAAIPILALFFVFNIFKQVKKGNNGWAFISSCMSTVLLLSLFAIGTFPVLVRSDINPEQYSLVISNSASSPLTLKILLYIVLMGLPLVIGYGIYIYHIFRGKVKLDDHSY